MILKKIIRTARKHLPALRVFTLIWLLMIALLCLIPQNDLPEIGGIPHLDKLVHFGLYFVLTFLSLFITSPSKKVKQKIIIITGIFLFSLFIELMQYLLPFGRTFSFSDLLANLSGIATGFLLFQQTLAQSQSF